MREHRVDPIREQEMPGFTFTLYKDEDSRKGRQRQSGELNELNGRPDKVAPLIWRRKD